MTAHRSEWVSPIPSPSSVLTPGLLRACTPGHVPVNTTIASSENRGRKDGFLPTCTPPLPLETPPPPPTLCWSHPRRPWALQGCRRTHPTDGTCLCGKAGHTGPSNPHPQQLPRVPRSHPASGETRYIESSKTSVHLNTSSSPAKNFKSNSSLRTQPHLQFAFLMILGLNLQETAMPQL